MDQVVSPLVRMEQAILDGMDECNAGRKWQEAADLYAAAVSQRVPLSLRLANAALLAFSKLSLARAAVELLAEMQAHGVQPDVDSFGRTIAACVKAKEWELTLDVFAGLDAAGLQPGTMLYNSALMACSNVGKLDLADELYQRARSAGGPCMPDIVTHTCMLSVYSLQGCWWRALRLYNEDVLPNMVPDVIFMLTILETLWHAGSVAAMRHAVVIFRDARRAGHLYYVAPYTGGDPELSLHSSTVASCELHLFTWLTMLRDWVRRTQQELPHVRVYFVKRVRNFAVRFLDVIASRMRALGCEPTFADTASTNPSLHWSGAAITAFLRSDCSFVNLLDPDLPDDVALPPLDERQPPGPEALAKAEEELTAHGLAAGSPAARRMLLHEVALHFELAAAARELGPHSWDSQVGLMTLPPAYVARRASLAPVLRTVADAMNCELVDVHDGLALLDQLMASGETDVTLPLLAADAVVALLAATAACLPNPAGLVQRMHAMLELSNSGAVNECVNLLALMCARARRPLTPAQPAAAKPVSADLVAPRRPPDAPLQRRGSDGVAALADPDGGLKALMAARPGGGTSLWRAAAEAPDASSPAHAERPTFSSMQHVPRQPPPAPRPLSQPLPPSTHGPAAAEPAEPWHQFGDNVRGPLISLPGLSGGGGAKAVDWTSRASSAAASTATLGLDSASSLRGTSPFAWARPEPGPPEMGRIPSAAACLRLMVRRIGATASVLPELAHVEPRAWAVLDGVACSRASLDIPPAKLAALVLTCCYAACGGGFGAPRAAIALFRLAPAFVQDVQPQLDEVRRLLEAQGLRLATSLVDAPGRERGSGADGRGVAPPDARGAGGRKGRRAGGGRTPGTHAPRSAPLRPPHPPHPLAAGLHVLDPARLQLAYELRARAERQEITPLPPELPWGDQRPLDALAYLAGMRHGARAAAAPHPYSGSAQNSAQGRPIRSAPHVFPGQWAPPPPYAPAARPNEEEDEWAAQQMAMLMLREQAARYPGWQY